MNTKTLKGRVANGVFWNTVQLVVNRGFDFLIKLVLAKLLYPEQFGLVGMAAVFASFVQVFNELGIGAALVQKKDADLREAHYHTAFWTGVIWSSFLYLLIAFVVAPLAAAFYNEPTLQRIIPILSIGVLSSPVNLVHNAQLVKAMNFKKLAFISNASKLFSGILSLTLALLGAGVWALVFNSVASFIIAMPLYFKATGWTPKFMWEEKAFRDIFGFGIYTTGTNVFNNLTSNIDYLLIGKLMSASALGTYTLAFVLTDTFRSQLMSIMNKVMYPVYGQKQDDSHALKKYYLNVVKYNSLVVYPIMVFIFVLGEPFVLKIFGNRWVDTIIPLKILALSVMVHMMVNSNTSLIRGLGKPGLEMRIQLFKTLLIYVPTIVVGIHYYGITGAACAILLNKILSVFIAQYFLKKLIDLSLIELIKELRVPVLASLIAFAASRLLHEYSVNFIVCAVVLLFTYIIVVWLMMKEEIISQLRSLGIYKPKDKII
ncbi:lipopolysaccharide biosynthesis protein [Pontibacter kalidii]|uniref:lipopolysaccharide biosynthesis protein n=1 Tax=Pontibacter kalidii TaxID=2592049 RepID=UPI00225A06ED|nr:lipopolysaccharide biosynthesis protein [Pontibacter kalidii]